MLSTVVHENRHIHRLVMRTHENQAVRELRSYMTQRKLRFIFPSPLVQRPQREQVHPQDHRVTETRLVLVR